MIATRKDHLDVLLKDLSMAKHPKCQVVFPSDNLQCQETLPPAKERRKSVAQETKKPKSDAFW